MSKFIVIEGLDGSGKSTQLNLLQDYLKQNNINFQYLHFPRLEIGIYGDLIARFLRGEFGKLEEVNPYLVALIYAGDRKDAASQINQWIEEGTLVILDRYLHSNIAYQCAKFEKPEDIRKLNDWIYQLEYEYYKIPKPDLSIFLHVPFSFVTNKLTDSRNGNDRDYLRGKQDIHESSMPFQKNVEKEYLRISKEVEKYFIINCSNNKGEMLSATDINKRMIELLKKEKIIYPLNH